MRRLSRLCRLLSLACLLSLLCATTIASPIRDTLPLATAMGSGTFRWFGLKLYGARIADASVDEMKKLGLGSPAQQRAWLEAMKQVFPDVEEGTQLVGIYQPGQPTRFFRNGTAIGDVADPEFGPAFFAIWLHPRTSAPKLRAALLGKP